MIIIVTIIVIIRKKKEAIWSDNYSEKSVRYCWQVFEIFRDSGRAVGSGHQAAASDSTVNP